ncbi:hypothetical protein MMC13_001190 [Lambiella insularis]|nr:hypothetical protein [Lambiella insularis]
MTGTATSSKPDHLCVLVHGLWGNPQHLEHLRSALQERHGKHGLHVMVATRNSSTFTYDGIEVGGERVAQEIEEEVDRLEKDDIHIKKLSMVGYSLGGLIARYTIGLLYSRGRFDNIMPVNFTTFATPHLGVRAPLRGYRTTAWNFIGSRTLSMSGQQLFLIDSFRADGRPLLSILADPNSIFIKALACFKRRTLYANIINDRSAPFYTTYISAHDPFVDLDAVALKYVTAYEPIILDGNNPVQQTKSKEELPFLSRLASRTSSILTQLPLYAVLAVLVPIGSTIFLLNSGIQNIRSSRRIRLHEEGKAGAFFKNYRIPYMIEGARNAVEDAIDDVNGRENREYLTEDGDSPPGNESKEVQSLRDGESIDREKPSISREPNATRLNSDPLKSFPTLVLTSEQFDMIKTLDNVGFRKFPVHIHQDRHSHAAIVVRHQKKGFEEGKSVSKHWLDKEFEL